MKKQLYLLITIYALLALQSCLLIDWAASSSSEPDTCTFKVENNSSDRVYVGGLMISDSLLIHEQSLGFLGYVDAHSLSDDMRLPIVPYFEESELTLELFFKTYHLDTLVVGLASNMELINQWVSNRNDSLLLKKINLTLNNLENEKKSFIIEYP